MSAGIRKATVSQMNRVNGLPLLTNVMERYNHRLHSHTSPVLLDDISDFKFQCTTKSPRLRMGKRRDHVCAASIIKSDTMKDYFVNFTLLSTDDLDVV